MRKAKAFLVVCAGIFLLALGYHLGATSAGAQAPGNPVVALNPAQQGSTGMIAVTANGDVFEASTVHGSSWGYQGNIFGGPTSVQPTTFGAIKAKFRR